MFRRAWKPVAATVAVGGTGYYLYKTKFVQNTFEIPVRVKSADGKSEMSTRTLPLLSLKELEARMNERASTHSNPRPTGVIFNHTTASLASNHPIEDANSHQIVQRDKDDPLYPGDYIFYAVMDGHGGFNTSQVLSRVLINAVALELSELIKPGSKQQSSSGGAYASVKSLFYGSPTEQTQAILSSDPAAVSLAIQNAFTKLDNEIINAPLRVLANNINEESRKNKVIPDLSQHPLGLTTMLPAISGSCALMAVFDTANRDLYIACTGDSRAVAGAWEPTSDGKGIWRVEVLSEDQTGRNPNELRRVQSEHPADEADYVIRNGRVLGGLEPTRAFGDARYKWPRPIQETLNQAFMAGNNKAMRPPPSLFKTPPYVTARPVVTHRKFTTAAAANSNGKPALRFVVLATDGLWDQLSSEDVVSLVGGHLSGLRGTIPKSTLPTLVPTTIGTPAVDGKAGKGLPSSSSSSSSSSSTSSTSASTTTAQVEAIKEVSTGAWAFQDANLSVHLVRNAFGGGDEMSLRRWLSIPAPYARRYRDDITVTVVWWEEGREREAGVSRLALGSQGQGQERTKL